jgi:hypothetical protein
MKAITPNANSENDVHQPEQSRVENGCDGSGSLTTRVRGKAAALWSGTKDTIDQAAATSVLYADTVVVPEIQTFVSPPP